MARKRHKPDAIVAKLRGRCADRAGEVYRRGGEDDRGGRYGYRRITAKLRHAGWAVNAKRVQRIWRREGLKVRQKQPRRGRLWLNDGSCVRLRAERPNHVWSYAFVEGRTHDGRKFRMLCIVDEFTREAMAIRVKRRLNSTDVSETLADLMILRGSPAYIRSDNVLILLRHNFLPDLNSKTGSALVRC